MSFNRLSKIIEELKIQVEEGIPVLVEGKKDEKALEELGIQGNFIKFQVQVLSSSKLRKSLLNYHHK